MKNFIIGVIATVLIGGAVYGGSQILNRKPDEKVVPPVEPTVSLEEEVTAAPGIKATDAPVIDETAAISDALYKKNNWPAGIATLSITYNDGKYAEGSVNGDGGGGYVYAIKAGGQWEIVADGNGIIDCAVFEKYPDYPNTLIKGCYNPATGETVQR